MKPTVARTVWLIPVVLVTLLIMVSVVGAQDGKVPNSPAAVGTSFTYQGQVKKDGAAYTGTCDFTFELYTDTGTFLSTLTTLNQPVSNGLFTVALNFGNHFTGDGRTLQVKLRCPAGAGVYETLTPRQTLTAVPYAIGLRPGATISATQGGDVFGVTSYGGGDALNAYAYGSGHAGYFVNNSVNNGNDAVYISTNGSGLAIRAMSIYTGTGCCPPAIRGDSTLASQGIGVLGVASAASGANYGVAGQTSSPQGKGVQGNAIAGGIGVYGVSTTGVGMWARTGGKTLGAPALYAENTDTTAAEPAGIAIYAKNASGDATIVAQNTGTGDSFRALSAAGSLTFRVMSTGKVVAPVVQITGGADVAERFATADNAIIEPGTVMVIDPDHAGKLKVSDSAYDSKVIGIVSGAGGVGTGLTLQHDGVTDGNLSVAMVGRVYCKADATLNPIKPGDFLTTATRPGYCMKAADRAQAQGATLGKAMTALERGTGLVLVVVNLQ